MSWSTRDGLIPVEPMERNAVGPDPRVFLAWLVVDTKARSAMLRDMPGRIGAVRAYEAVAKLYEKAFNALTTAEMIEAGSTDVDYGPDGLLVPANREAQNGDSETA